MVSKADAKSKKIRLCFPLGSLEFFIWVNLSSTLLTCKSVSLPGINPCWDLAISSEVSFLSSRSRMCSISFYIRHVIAIGLTSAVVGI